MMFIGQQRYVVVIRNHNLGRFADDRYSLVTDNGVASLREQDHIVTSPAAGFLANR